MFYERLQVLCHERKLSVSAALQIMGVSSGNITHWRKGRLPKGKTLRRMAQFFDVPVDFLIGSKQESLAVQQEKLLLLFESVPAEKRADLLRQFEKMTQRAREDADTQ
ncbi:MAG: helix-turn-helix transcriptional regulator [Clostridia bacterium]|nr:helix-turn-helix transcriptional regulator [Clostridia bacterium]